MNIVISGLTAAGKTTHALLLARWLGFNYVSASQLMLKKIDIPVDENNALWVTRMGEIETRRDSKPVDRDVNELLLRALKDNVHTIFDSWALPWLADQVPCLRIWMESSLESRALKARVSQEPYGPILSLEACRDLVVDKDRSTARRLEPLLGVDIRHDRSVFDLVLDNSTLISEPTIKSARQGISKFHLQLIKEVAGHIS